MLSKNPNFVQKSKFSPKIQIMFKNPNFVEKSKCCPEIESFAQKSKLCSKIQRLSKNPNFVQKIAVFDRKNIILVKNLISEKHEKCTWFRFHDEK